MNAPLPTLTPAAAVALPFHPHDGQPTLLPLDCLFVKAGFNPRQFFEDAEFTALVESVRQQGVVQALWVRPQEDFDPETPRFWLIAGERRWRAAQVAGIASVPVTIRVVDERHALLLADLENNPALRIGLSVAEEARFAQRFLAECDGDRDEAARLLGWSRTKLDARLLLLHATASALDALTQRKIKTGHAELLAGLPPSTQDGTLAKILRDGIPIADLKARIKSFALDLSTAIFDKTDCAACPHHSSLQEALFAEAVAGGRCQNRTCFAEKTQTALQARQTELQSEYATVFLDTERPADTYTVLAKTGPQGVGEAQFTACQGCQHFAARLSTQPGREGIVQGPLCVNLTCHREKVAAGQPAVTPSAPPTPTTTARSVSGTAASGAPVPSTPAPKTAATPKKVDAWVDGWLRRQAAEAVTGNPDLLRAWLLSALYRDVGQPTALLTQAGVRVERPATRAALLPALFALSPERKQALLIALVRHGVQDHTTESHAPPGQSEEVNAALAALTTVPVDLTAAFTPDAGFWEAHTKAGIESLLRAAKNPDGESFADGYARRERDSETDGKAFERLMKGKLADLIRTLSQTAFDFSAWLPKVIAQRRR